MARIRSIKPEFFTSEQVAECSTNARLLFVGMWCFCDDQGVHPASSARLKMEIFPGDTFTKSDIDAMVAELIDAGLLCEYTVDAHKYWIVTGWKHQKIDKPSSKYPLPLADDSPNGRRMVAERSGTDVEGRGCRGDVDVEGKKEPSSLRSDSQSPNSELPTADPETSTVRQHPASERLFAAVLETYHRRLPKCQHVSVLNPKRRKRIQAADKLARQVCREQRWPYDPAGFWDAYFAECEGDPWMRGEVANPRNPAWKQNLDVLLAEDRFAGIMDRAIEAMRREAAA